MMTVTFQNIYFFISLILESKSTEIDTRCVVLNRFFSSLWMFFGKHKKCVDGIQLMIDF